jgi:hypothetical protein
MARSMLVAAVAAIALGSSAHQGSAHPAAGEANKRLAHHEAHSAAHERSREVHRAAMAHRSSRRAAAFGAPPFYVGRPGFPVYRWPGYTYVPRVGIVDEACNLPTSACPNEMRDIR